MNPFFNLPNSTILLVDDEPSILYLLTDYLEKIGAKVISVSTSRDGLIQAEQAQPDLILLDINLPDADGFMTCQALKANPLTRTIPVIFLSVLNTLEHKMAGFQAGGVDYINKPLQEWEVLARINVHLQLRHTQQLFAAQKQLADNIIEHLPIGLQIFNNEGFLLHQNPAQAKLFNLANTSIGVGEFNISQTPSSIANGSAELFTQVSAGELVANVEQTYPIFPPNLTHYPETDPTIHVEPDNQQSVKYFNRTLFPIKGKSEVLFIVSLMDDITERKQTELALQQSETNYRLLADNSAEIIALFRHSQLVYISPGVEKLLGYTPEVFKQLNHFALIHPDDRPELESTIRARCENKIYSQVSYSYRQRHQQGHYIWLETVETSKIIDSQTQDVIMILTSRDITARKLAEQQLVKTNRHLQALTHCRQAIMQYEDELNLLDAICEIITEIMKYDLTWIGYKENTPDKKVKIMAYRGFKLEYLKSLSITWGDDPRGNGPVGRAIKQQQPQIFSIHDLDFKPWQEAAKKQGFQAIAALPLMNKNTVIGAIAFYSPQALIFDNDEVIFLKNIAQDLSLGITSLRHHHESEQAKQALEKSERRFREIIEYSPVAIVITDADNHILKLNQKFTQLFGYTQADIPTLEDWNQLAFPQPQEQIMKRWQQDIVAGREAPPRKAQVMTKEGQQCFIEMTMAPVGEYFVIILIDITKRRQAQQQLRHREQFLRTIYEGIQLPIFIINVDETDEIEPKIDFRIGGLNPAYEQLLGWRHQNLLNQRLEDIEAIAPETVSIIRANYTRCLAAKKTIRYEECLTLNNREYWWLTQLSPIKNEQDKIIQLIGSTLEITELKQMHKALQEAKEQAEAANHAKSEFIANMSHELRTPLNAILGFAQILRRDTTLSANQHEQIATIEQSGNHLLTLLNDLLDLAKLDAGQLDLQLSSVNLPHFFNNLINMMQIPAQQKQIKLYFQADENLPVLVKMDEKRLRQVIFNLLGNAIKFTQQGKVTLNIKCQTWDQDQITLRIEVIDTGIGIAQAQQTKIFEAFERAGEKRLYSNGMGLGLTMSYQLLQLMKGKIEVDSTPGKGSCFSLTVTLPVIESRSLQTQPPLAHHLEIGTDTEEIKIPPRSQLESLYELAIVGKIFQIKEWITQMRELDAIDNQYTAFIDKIDKMAKKFQIKQITLTVKKYLD